MSDMARMLADTTERLLERHPARDAGSAAALLAAVHESGLTLALLDEEQGGGCTVEDAAEICRAWGRRAAALPIVELLLAPRLAAYPGMPEQSRSVAVAYAPRLRVVSTGGGASLEGPPVEAAAFDGCETVLAVAEASDGSPYVVALPAQGEQFRNLSGEAWLRILPAGLAPGVASTVPIEREAADALARDGALLTAAVICGLMRGVVAQTIEHANTRVQFGRALSKFQAVQHLIAEIVEETTVTEGALRAALAAAARGAAQPLDWLAVKVQAGRAATAAASAAHQIFGAIGFTEEHDLHHYSKRLWALRDGWGRQTDCEERIGRLAAEAGCGGLWSLIADGRE